MNVHPLPRLALAGAVVVLLTLTGCSVTQPGPPEPTTPSTASAAAPSSTATHPHGPADPADAVPSAQEVRRTGTELGVGGLVLRVLSGEASEPVPADDGSLTVTIGGPAAPPAGAEPHPIAVVTAAQGTTFSTLPDGSVLLGTDGAALAAMVPPTGPAGTAYDVLEPDLLAVLVEAGNAADDERRDVVLTVGDDPITSTDWGEREGGRSLAVAPAAWARTAGEAGLALTWERLLAAEPEADTGTMYDQLVCHSIGAPEKATWNLEPWRPDVGLLAVLAARCNPT